MACPPDRPTADRELMPELIVFRGLPASGKTTLARQWVEAKESRARVNRDDLRAMMHDGVYSPENEEQIVAARDDIIGALFDLGVSVVCDDTNLKPQAFDDLTELAFTYAVPLRVWDLTAVPVDECVERDKNRASGRVGEEVIRGMAEAYLPLA